MSFPSLELIERLNGSVHVDLPIGKPLQNLGTLFLFPQDTLFGFLVYFIIRLVMNKKKLKNPFQMEEESRWQQDERRILVGEKAAKLSGDLTLVGLTLAVFVTSLYNMDMFNALYYTLLGCILLRAGSWFYYSRKY